MTHRAILPPPPGHPSRPKMRKAWVSDCHVAPLLLTRGYKQAWSKGPSTTTQPAPLNIGNTKRQEQVKQKKKCTETKGKNYGPDDTTHKRERKKKPKNAKKARSRRKTRHSP